MSAFMPTFSIEGSDYYLGQEGLYNPVLKADDGANLCPGWGVEINEAWLADASIESAKGQYDEQIT